jgi:predicted flap endonuclease-1-like 5' DNA nuclease
MNISSIEGIGPAMASKLAEQGIRSTDALLKSAADRKGRRALAKETGISTKQILNWVNKADLMRIRGIGEEYSDLLEAAGVDTVRELAVRNPYNLHSAMQVVNDKKSLVRRVPSLVEVESWVMEAKKLAPMVTY